MSCYLLGSLLLYNLTRSLSRKIQGSLTVSSCAQRWNSPSSIGFAFPETCCEHLIIEGIISILCHRASLSMFKAPALQKVTWNYHILL
ncbi:hypothetical protein F5J12DRAFT_356007 [Pisolithus orientalis]|uniref:uncharacterized protein n=1 Tax=Pisolithus orientalis TaxID=936130 RepID=UPI0022247A05|nr:uncharacterized protein F5J12DRAFT_356007 [Pisolithus orientalis]KAI5996480.1 hypothetical protein F5J12DRAFT_356007 [Pisolithus orientalis]